MRTAYCSTCLTSFSVDAQRCPNLGCGLPRPAVGWSELLGPGDVLDRHYRIRRVLALAGGGVTYAARALDALDAEAGPELAIKVLYAQRDSGEYLLRLANEAQVLRHLAHPHIVECMGFVHRDGAPPYLITRFERGGTLSEHVERVGPLRPDVAAAAALQIVRALQQAHAHAIVHRDMKPQNVLLRAPCDRDDVPALRVADFGIAKVRGGLGDGRTRAGAFIGTPEYAAPEQFEGQPPTPAADLYAAGAVFHALLTGRPSFTPTNRMDTTRSLDELLVAIPPRLAHAGPAWRAAQAVLDATMQPDPAARADGDALVALLEAVVRLGAADTFGGRASLRDGATILPGLDLDDAPSLTGAWSGAPPAAVRRAPSLTFIPDEPPSPPPRAPVLRDRTSTVIEPDLPTPPTPPRAAAPPVVDAPPGPAAAPRAPTTTHAPPSPPTTDAAARLTALGHLHEGAQEAAEHVAALIADARGLSAAAAAHRPGDDPSRGVGLCRFAVAASRADWTSRLRGLLSDSSPEVRAAAIRALGAVGTVQALSALPPLTRDPVAEVRFACAHALAELGVRHRRPDLARPALEQLERDPADDVRWEARQAHSRMARG